jgi:hypothetical protein
MLSKLPVIEWVMEVGEMLMTSRLDQMQRQNNRKLAGLGSD